MRASEVVVENMIDADDKRPAYLLIREAHHAERLANAYPTIPDNVRATALQADPTGGSYANWIIDKAIAGTIALPEDSDKVRELLTQFHRLKQSPKFQGNRNIYAYKTYGDLAKAVQGQETQSRHIIDRNVAGQKLLGKHGNLELISLTTPEASAEVCKHTHWCIRKPDVFRHYYRNGPLYVVIKDGQPYVAVEPRAQAMDVYDDPIDEQTAKEIAPLFLGISLSGHALRTDRKEYTQQRIKQAMEAIRNRFIDERLRGYTNSRGRTFPPVNRQEAERQWKESEPQFARTMPALGSHFDFVNDGLANLAHAVEAIRPKHGDWQSYQ